MGLRFVTGVSAALALLAATAAAAQPPTTIPMKFAPAPPQPRGHFVFNGFGFGFATPIVERELVTHVIEREVIHEVPVEAAPPPQPREPYVIGHSYKSLPAGCSKLITGGGKANYFLCRGEWYLQTGDSSFKAVEPPL